MKKIVKITYFVHGTTTDNENKLSSGWHDAELSSLGIQQSLDLKKRLQGKKFDAVFCSDLKRAVDSAQLVFEGTATVIKDKRLRECNYGTFNAKPTAVVEQMQENFIDKRFPKGESYEDVKMRIADFLAFLKKNYCGKNVAIVGHKGPQLALDVILKRKVWKRAFAEDWRKTKAWQPGWDYELRC